CISAVRLVDAATCGYVGVNFFNKLLFVSLTPVMHLRLRLNDASSRRSPKKFESAIKTLCLILSSPSPTFELSHVHLQPSSSLISISDVDLEISLLRRRLSRALSSLKLITSSLISDGYYELSHLCLSRALLSPPIWVSNIVEVWSSKLLSLELALHRLHRSQALSISLISASLSSLQTDEAKIRFLELRTKIKRNDD
ncbi:hypothetical protein HID58_079333, partial [Brassica napus]